VIASIISIFYFLILNLLFMCFKFDNLDNVINYLHAN